MKFSVSIFRKSVEKIEVRMHLSCRITEVTDTQNMQYIAFPRQQCLLERASILHYKYTYRTVILV